MQWPLLSESSRVSNTHLDGNPVGRLFKEPGAAGDAVRMLRPVHAAHPPPPQVRLIQATAHREANCLPMAFAFQECLGASMQTLLSAGR